jgi:hypothetical protein
MAIGVAAFGRATRVTWLTAIAVLAVPCLLLYLLIRFQAARREIRSVLYGQRNRGWSTLSIREVACLLISSIFPALFR